MSDNSNSNSGHLWLPEDFEPKPYTAKDDDAFIEELIKAMTTPLPDESS